MTTIYFVRHAQADNSVRVGRIRPLTPKGLADRRLVTAYLSDKSIDAVLSSPFRRAIDTVAEFAKKSGLEIETVEDFRERKSDSDMRKDHPEFTAFLEHQWADFQYTCSDGESLAQVQLRNLDALNTVLTKHRGQNLVIGTHGTALATILQAYDPAFGFADFMEMLDFLPWIVKMTFDGNACTGMEKIDLFASPAK